MGQTRFLSYFIATFFAFTTLEAIAQTPTTPCEIRSIIQRENLDPNRAQVVLADGTVYNNPFATKTAQISTATKIRTDAEMNKIFDDVRDSLIFEISGGQNFNELSAYQKLMVSRLRSLNRPVIKKCSNSKLSDLTNPGADNDLLENQISVCDRLRSAPEIALVAVFGHEFGHSLDLVNLGCRTYRIKNRGTRLDDWYRRHPSANLFLFDETDIPENPLEAPLHSNDFQKRLKQISDADRSFNECAFTGRAEKKEIARLLNAHLIETVDDGIPLIWHPQRGVFQCMAKNYRWPQIPGSQDDAERGGYSEYGERSAQIWGARAVASYAQKHPQLTAKEAMGLVQYTQIYTNIEKGQSLKELELDQLYLSEPALQNLLRCQPNEKQNCLSYLKTNQSFMQNRIEPRSATRNRKTK